MSRQVNIARIKTVAHALQDLNQKVVFVGGATVALYADNPAAPEARPTDDVDVVVELTSYGGYAGLEEQLRRLGFSNDSTSNIICRFQVRGITVDVMPTQPHIIGFNNQWYPEGFARAVTLTLDRQEINVFPLPYFLATKLEAFKSRGHHDYRTSSDFEDIVYVFENNTGLSGHLAQTTGALRQYLKVQFARLVTDPDFEEGLYSHLEPFHAKASSTEIIKILRRFISA